VLFAAREGDTASARQLLAAGADMLGTIEFNSACFYRYANVDFDQPDLAPETGAVVATYPGRCAEVVADVGAGDDTGTVDAAPELRAPEKSFTGIETRPKVRYPDQTEAAIVPLLPANESASQPTTSRS